MFNKLMFLLLIIPLLTVGTNHVLPSPIKAQTNQMEGEIMVDDKTVSSSSKLSSDQYDLTTVREISFIDNPDIKELLAKNGFAVIPQKTYLTIEGLYQYLEQRGVPIFVTTDAILHTSHVLFNYILRIVEIKELISDLTHLSRELVHASIEQYKQASDSDVRQAALNNAAFFSVALKVLDKSWTIPELISDTAKAEIRLIQTHDGWHPSPIFEAPQSKYLYREDYSQYVPRGHYTRNEKFASYFKAMMWYGRMLFPLPNNQQWEIDDFLKRVTRQALLVTQALMSSQYLNLWERIYQTTSFFVERSDDLTPFEYVKLMKEIYGPAWKSVDSLRDDDKLHLFITKAMKFRDPQIESGIKWTEEATADQFYQKGLKFIGQRFTPDAHIFQKLVYPNVSSRFLPKGLDVMTVLSSETAEQILQSEGDFDLPGYEANLEKLRREFVKLTSKDWTTTLYWNWLYSLKPLLTDTNACSECPSFMQSNAWMKKALNTALASWAELRHDTILYVKQSYTPSVSAPLQFRGYVEPYPEVYHRLTNLVKQMREGLVKQDLIIEKIKAHLLKFEKILDKLISISVKELRGEPITKEGHKWISRIGYNLQKVTQFSEQIMEEITGKGDASMMTIADVHTDANSRQVLEEGIGYPFLIYVITPLEEKLVLTQGAAFSYYEFPWPMDDRLTDEKWQQMLEGGKDPGLPKWTETVRIEENRKEDERM